MTPASRRSATPLLVGAAVVTLTAGCVITAPAPPAPVETTATTTAPEPAPTESAEPTEPSETAAASEGPYEITAEGQDGSVWSFEVTDSRVVETDSGGQPAEPGFQLVEVLVDAELLEGEPDFYHAFHIYIVDDATGDEYGLSTASSFYAEGDLFTTGQEPSITGGVGIFHVPASLGIDHVRVTTDQGGVWDFSR
ncbi:hypothetical protein ABIB37_000437 [Agrococcus sp. UYP10]|uniref:hypothetical protein n=1 Tax=Agrococcus sp. UYP10 TaxID=1756355 RepID=UPI0033939305